MTATQSTHPTESAGERSATPRTEQIVERGLASMKAAGMNTQHVYDACAVFVKELGEHAIAQERDLTAARQRIEGLEGELELALNLLPCPHGLSPTQNCQYCQHDYEVDRQEFLARSIGGTE